VKQKEKVAALQQQWRQENFKNEICQPAPYGYKELVAFESKLESQKLI
jgi:hypothetical protein